jgi:hypothetical protein
MEKKIIAWEKWFDPYGEDINVPAPDSIIEDDFEDNDEWKSDLKVNNALNSNKTMRFIATPMGMVPLVEQCLASRIFNFYNAHTNFNITPKIINIIQKVDGVETLDVFTRYRMRVGFGKAFDVQKVKSNISAKLTEHFNHDQKRVEEV